MRRHWLFLLRRNGQFFGKMPWFAPENGGAARPGSQILNFFFRRNALLGSVFRQTARR